MKRVADQIHRLMEDRLAAATPTVRPGGRSGYHGITFGWLVSGLARAVTGSDMRDLFRSEVAGPLGLDGVRLGVAPDDEEGRSRLATLLPTGLSLAAMLGGPFGRLLIDKIIIGKEWNKCIQCLQSAPPV